MQRVYIASPFRGATKEETRQNIVYARMCMQNSLIRGEAPYLSHLLYTQVYSEDPAMREAGLAAGDAWRESAELVAIYTDLGITPGMQRAIDKARPGTCVCRVIDASSNQASWRDLLAMAPFGDFVELSR